MNRLQSAPLLLAVSLLANGALVAALALGPSAKSSAPGAPASPTGEKTATAAHAGNPSARAHAAGPSAAAQTGLAQPWAGLRTDNFDQLVRSLRAAGFTPREVRAMLAAAIRDQANARREALLGKQEDAPYWRSPNQTNRMIEAQQEEFSRIHRDMRDLEFKYVNGPDALADDEDLLIATQRRFGILPLATLQRLMVLQRDFEDRRMALYARPSPTSDRAARQATEESMGALQQAHLDELARLLTPAQLEQYELRNNTEQLRRSLANFRPNEEEFKLFHRLQKQTGRPMFAPAVLSSPDFVQFNAELQAGLGPERYEEFSQLRSSEGFGKLGQLLARLELPLTTITTINTVQDHVQTRVSAIVGDAALSPAERQTRLATLARETQATLTSALGARGYEAYVDMKGDWIRALQPRPASESP